MRTAEPASFLPMLHKLTAKARETLAADLFAIDTVRETLTRGASLGRDRIFLRPKTPLDLRQTAAAVALVEHLAALGAATFWHPYAADQDGHAETGQELEIAWRKTG